MQNINPRGYFLLQGQRVRLHLLAADTVYGEVIEGTITDEDIRGLVIQRTQGEVLFVPWTAMLTVTRLPT